MDKIQFRPLKEGDSVYLKILFEQLSPNSIGKDIDLNEMISDPKCHCVVGQIENEVVGFGALVRYTVPSKGEVGRIEDVIIAEKYRGNGFGKAIILELISIASEENINLIDLTSSRVRTSARKLYESLGFKMRESDIYRLEL